MSNLRASALILGLGVGLLPSRVEATSHFMDILELANGGGTEAVLDGKVFANFPGSETISFGANLNDGAYTPQIVNVNLYDDVAHTIVSDRFTITVFAANPDQITLGLTSLTPGTPLQPLSPENIGLTETGGLQVVTTLTASNGSQTTIRLQSDEATAPAPVPEPSVFMSIPIATLIFLGSKLRFRRHPAKLSV
jgi:hypothetical protein